MTKTNKRGEEFSAEKLALWAVDGTRLTLVTDANLSIEKCRKNILADLAGKAPLVCVHFSDSFRGETGTSVHGRGWKFHTPQEGKTLSLWEAADFASKAPWTEVTPGWARAAK